MNIFTDFCVIEKENSNFDFQLDIEIKLFSAVRDCNFTDDVIFIRNEATEKNVPLEFTLNNSKN